MDFPKNSNVVIIRLIHLKKKKIQKPAQLISNFVWLVRSLHPTILTLLTAIISKYIHSAF